MRYRGIRVACGIAAVVGATLAACSGEDDPNGEISPGPDSSTPNNASDVVTPPVDAGSGDSSDAGDATLPFPTMLDPTFGVGGLSILKSSALRGALPKAILRQPDGKLIVAGLNFITRLSATGVVDTTFGEGGRRVFDSDAGWSAALQADGKILVGGSDGIARLNTDGTLDATFGTKGWASLPGVLVTAISVLGSGKIVIGGTRLQAGHVFTVARVTAAGVMDTTFDSDGFAQPTAFSGTPWSIAVDAQGRLVVSGEPFTQMELPVARYLDNGTLDGTFGVNGQVSVAMAGTLGNSCVALQADGKIVVAGMSAFTCATFRLSGSDGAIDTTFGASDGGPGPNGGIVLGPTCPAVGPIGLGVRADGKIVVGKQNGWFQLGSDGVLDATFGTGGETLLNSGSPTLPMAAKQWAMTLLADGTIAGAGMIDPDSSATSMWKGTSAGILDTTFGTNGQSNVSFQAGRDELQRMEVLADDSILFAGSGATKIVAGRFTANGVIDGTFGAAGFAELDAYQFAGMARDGSGKVFVAGDSRIFALSSQGVPEAAFNGASGVSVEAPALNQVFYPSAVAVDQSGRPIVAGLGYGNPVPMFVVRYTTAGQHDTTFGSVVFSPSRTAYTRNDMSPREVAVLSNGKILVAGNGPNNGDACLVRLDANGVLDASFGKKTYPGLTVESITVQTDDKVLLVGSAIARVDTNGVLDATFGSAGVSTALQPSGLVPRRVRVLADGRLVVAGDKDNGGTRSIGVASLTATGALEVTILPTTPVETRAYDFGFQTTGAIVVGGYAVGVSTGRDYLLARFK